MLICLLLIAIIVTIIAVCLYVLGKCELIFEGNSGKQVYTIIQLLDNSICSGGGDNQINIWNLQGRHLFMFI